MNPPTMQGGKSLSGAASVRSRTLAMACAAALAILGTSSLVMIPSAQAIEQKPAKPSRFAKPKPPPPPAGPTGTIKDLEKVEVPVPRDQASNVLPQQAAEQYRRFLEQQTKDDKLRADATRRLGDLQLEMDEAARAAGVDDLTSLQLKEAITLYEGLLKAQPNYARNDTVMYQLARAYEAEAQPEKALAVLDRLVMRYPTSKWTVESQFRRGEILFTDSRYKEAERAYSAVIAAGPTGGFYEQGLYKHGWSLFKQSRGEESVASFLKVIDNVLIESNRLLDRNGLTRPQRELSDDAFRAVAITFYDLDGAQTLDGAMKQRGDPLYAHLLYETLGDLYLQKERFQDAALAYEAFAKRRPDSRYAPSLQVRAIESYQKGGLSSLVLDGKRAFVERYAFGSAFWRERTVTEAPEVAALLKTNQKDLAEYHYEQAQKLKRPEEYTQAARWYRAMLDSFPDDAEAPATRYVLGDVLYESNRFAEAANEYERTAYGYSQHPKSAAAGYAALVSYQKHEPTISGQEQADWHRKSIESSLRFANTFVEHPEAPQVLTKADEELYALKEYDRVIEVSQQLLERRPAVEPKFQRIGATLLANSLFERGRFTEAEQAYKKVQTYLPANDPDRKTIEERLAASIYKQAEEKQTAGDSSGAVADFLRIAGSAPNSKVRVNAEFDAASILIKNQQWERAAQVLEAFRASYPSSELAPEVTRSLAVAYFETGRSGEAAAEFERIADRPEESADLRRQALSQAANLYEKAQQPGGAARTYAKYVQQFPMPLDPAQNARQKLADMAQANNQTKTRGDWIAAIIAADKAAGTQRTDRSRFLAARATLETVQPQITTLNGIKLVAPLSKSIKTKRAALEKVLATYSQALDYGVAEVTTAATYGMAEQWRQLGSELLASERPKELKGEALEQYDVLLEEQAFPFEEKSIEIHESNAKRIGDGLYDEWVRRSFEVLAKLQPARYGKAEVSDDYATTLR